VSSADTSHEWDIAEIGLYFRRV